MSHAFLGFSSPYQYRAATLSGVCFTLLLPFALLYVEYEYTEKVTKSILNVQLGYAQALFCWAALLYAMLAFSQQPSATSLLLLVSIVGHAIFLINVVWTYLTQKPLLTKSSATRSLFRPTKVAASKERPPAQLFGISAVVFALLSGVFALSQTSTVPFPLHGQVSLVPASLLALSTVTPFALFAALYWLLEHYGRRTFTMSSTRLHLILTLGLVLDAARIYTVWAETWVTDRSAVVSNREIDTIYAFAAASVIAFVWNVLGPKLEWFDLRNSAQRIEKLK